MRKNYTSALIKHFKAFQLLQIVSFITFSLLSSCSKQNIEEPYLLGLGTGINSSTLFVDDLETTRNYFKDTLGFNFTDEIKKGTIDGSLVSSISFADMSCLELLSLNDTLRNKTDSSFIASFLEKIDGVGLYTLSSSSVDSTSLWLNSRKYKMDSIQFYRSSEESPKGWSWDTGGPEKQILNFVLTNTSALLPRFIEEAYMDYKAANEQWRTYYSYGRRYVEHPNGVVGTSAIRIAVEDIKTASEEFQKMGFSELELNDTLARYKLFRNQEIDLIASHSAGNELSNFLSKRGSGVFAIRLEVKNIDSTYAFLKERLPAKALVMKDLPKRLTVLKEFANGVQLEFLEESEEQGAMAQMLRPDDDLDSTSMEYAAGLFEKYCSLCHGKDREGYAADHAPSLHSHSLLATSKSSNFLRYTI